MAAPRSAASFTISILLTFAVLIIIHLH